LRIFSRSELLDNELVVTFTSSDSEEESPKKRHWLFNRSSDEEETQYTAPDIFGSDSSDSSEEESPKKKCCSKKESPEKYKCCTRCDHSYPICSDDHCDSSDADNNDGSVLVHTDQQNEQEPNHSEEEIQHEYKILLEYLAQQQYSKGSDAAATSSQEEYCVLDSALGRQT
jgi:hypothetical protein